MVNDFIYTEGGLDRAGFLFRLEQTGTLTGALTGALTGTLTGALTGTRPVGMGREN